MPQFQWLATLRHCPFKTCLGYSDMSLYFILLKIYSISNLFIPSAWQYRTEPYYTVCDRIFIVTFTVDFYPVTRTVTVNFTFLVTAKNTVTPTVTVNVSKTRLKLTRSRGRDNGIVRVFYKLYFNRYFYRYFYCYLNRYFDRYF